MFPAHRHATTPRKRRLFKRASMTFANRLQTVRLRSDLGQHPPETVKRSQPFASRLSRKNPDHVLDEHFARRPSNLPTPLRVAGGLPTRFRVWAGFSANVWLRCPATKTLMTDGFNRLHAPWDSSAVATNTRSPHPDHHPDPSFRHHPHRHLRRR